MIKINGMCMGFDAIIAEKMHDSLSGAIDNASPLIITSFMRWQVDISPVINLVIIKINQQSDIDHIEQLKNEHPGVALIIYLEETNSAHLINSLFIGWHGVCYHDDISNRLPAIALLAVNIKRREIKNDIFFQIAKHLADMTRFQDAVASVLKNLCHLFQWRAGEIWALNDLLLQLTYVVGFSDSMLYHASADLNEKHHFKKGQGLPGFFYEQDKVVVLTHFEHYLDQDYLEIYKENNLVSCIGVPIRFQQQLFGMMIFWSEQQIVIDDSMTILLQEIGDQFGEFIKKKRLQGDLLYLSQHDSLTHLANKAMLIEHAELAINRAIKEHHLVALFCIDVDSFKAFNELYVQLRELLRQLLSHSQAAT